MSKKLIFELSSEGRKGYRFPDLDVPELPLKDQVSSSLLRNSVPVLPEVSEVDIIRHYNGLAKRNFGLDAGFYPLGSCTMKYNPKVNEDVGALPGFANIHPLQSDDSVQGFLEIIHELTKSLCEITGMKWGTLQPYAGAHGEFAGMKFFKSYFKKRGELNRTRVLVPTSAHGTNPASATIAGFVIEEIHADERGLVSVEDLKRLLKDDVAGIMLTNPNTLGLFEKDIIEIAKLVHDAGGLLYYDGANMNAIMGKVRPGDMGFDVVHLNLHKTFSTPHGGGGPGAGPVLVSERLVDFVPTPDVKKNDDGYYFDYDLPDTMGRISGFYGNMAVLVRAYAYAITMGGDGLQKASEYAVLNANYLKERLKTTYHLYYDTTCMHEFVLSMKKMKEEFGISSLDIAKGLLDYGVHPPTIYFPSIVPESMMIEPTETESKETLDNFVEIMLEIYQKAKTNPDELHTAPHNTAVRRVDEVMAVKQPILKWHAE
ncbi:MAG: aminomethyl-transferring glycine dehydrogenase subunit GcvPB [Spirochaetia bacterium]|jgi:glycine dehydrogenase subunit 2|nr:aminomethyl-transferring glycine dehydrogenase subunit GcvPB [Spirochaetia bacterium]